MSRPTLRQATGPAHTRILGLGAVRGENVVTNDDIAGPIDSSDEWIRQRTPMKRWGSAEDLMGAALFLSSPASAYMTGQVMVVDGGMTVVI